MIRGQQHPKAVALSTIMLRLIDAVSDENVTAKHLQEGPVPIGWDKIGDAARC
ncbi:hypothetical protein ACWCHM_21660 [Micromonospora sp. SCSIO 07396]